MRDSRDPRSNPTRPSLRAQVGVAALGGVAVILTAQIVLAGTATGLGVAMAAFLLAGLLLADRMRRGYPHDRIGACNAVTLLRAALACALLAPLVAGEAAGWAVAGVAGLGLMLDGVDGYLARRSGLVSRLGARFDMETDAALALILALHVLAGTDVGPEILMLGLVRYFFVLTSLVLPWLRADLPDRRWRRVICVVQLSALIVLQTPLVTPDGAILLARLAAALLIGSFAVDIRWLWLRR